MSDYYKNNVKAESLDFSHIVIIWFKILFTEAQSRNIYLFWLGLLHRAQKNDAIYILCCTLFPWYGGKITSYVQTQPVLLLLYLCFV